MANEARSERFRELIENTFPEVRADFQTHKMKKRLDLDEDQVRKVGKINLKHARKVQHVVESYERPFREFGEHRDRELKSVLIAKQYSDYLDMKKEMHEHLMELR